LSTFIFNKLFQRLGVNPIQLKITYCKIIIKNPSTLRLNAASVDYSTLATFDGSTVTAITNVVVDGNQTTPDYSEIDCTVASGLTQFRPYFLISNNDSNGFIGLSAEL
jgi:hypothetical protein